LGQTLGSGGHGPGVLGEDFLIGVATSGYQIEGGFNGEGEPQNNWSGWEGTGRAARSGRALDFWCRPTETLDRTADIGCNAFRLSVEWSRLEPHPGTFDQGALERYAEILAMCVARGMAPMVTLHHFTHPAWLGDEFWLRPGSPDVFTRHVERVVPALAPHCRHWVTINEPNIVTLMGWVEGAAPPGRRMAVSDAYCVLDNLLTAHVLAADAIVAVQPEAQVTLNTSSSSVYEHDRLLFDLLLSRSAGVDPSDVDRYVEERRAVHDATFVPRHAGEAAIRRWFAAVSPYGGSGGGGGGRVWGAVRNVTARRAPRRVLDAVWASRRERTVDAVGFDWYDPVASHAVRLPGRRTVGGGRDWTVGRAHWDVEAHPSGLRSWCTTEAALRPGLPLWVVENGMATQGAALRADGLDRPRYVREHLGAVADAVGAGVPVTAYFHWSLADNYEWGSYEPCYGLFGVEHDAAGIPHWLDTDAQGNDAAGEFRRVAARLRAGDHPAADVTQ
jgi:beta-glucosidase/6-phospho-beta-glucosidase/beta-galactosidase